MEHFPNTFANEFSFHKNQKLLPDLHVSEEKLRLCVYSVWECALLRTGTHEFQNRLWDAQEVELQEELSHHTGLMGTGLQSLYVCILDHEVISLSPDFTFLYVVLQMYTETMKENEGDDE